MASPSPLRIEHQTGDRFTVEVRGHRFTVDQPVEEGGGDAGPTPTELFVASLAACVGFFARRYLARHHLPDDVEVAADYTLSQDRPSRVDRVTLRICTAVPVPPERETALLRVVEHCTVHNSLRDAPAVDMRLEAAQPV
jgi:putative redox protein